MKKIILVLAVLVLAVPVMAVHTNVTATATQVGTTDEFDIIVTWSGGGSPPRAFAIDVNVGGGQTITEISGYHIGESNASGKGYGIFPASFARVINADFNNFDDANYTPVAVPADLPGDTLGGLNTSGVTLELGSLYVGAPNKPISPSTLARLKVSGDCTICIATNVGRGKIVLEDGNEPNEPSGLSMGCTAFAIACTVPDVVGDSNAVAKGKIVAAGFVATSTSGHDCDVTAGNVISQSEAPGTEPGCLTTVNIVVADGDTIVPNVVGQAEATAIANIEAAGLVASVSYAHDCAVTAGDVISQNPVDGGATAACASTVDIVVSDGDTIIPNVVGQAEATAIANIEAADLVASVSYVHDCDVTAGDVISQNPVDGGATAACASTVDIVVADGNTIMPDIMGMTQADANAAIIAAGLAVGTIDWDTSWTVDVNLVMAQDPNSGTELSCNPSTPNFTMSSGCYTKFPVNPPLTWGGWVAAGRPLSWCGPFGNVNSLPNSQCAGDASNSTGPIGRGTFTVEYQDITILLAGFNKAYSDPITHPWIAADFDHKTGAIGRGQFRVAYEDIAILLANFNQAVVPNNCP